MYWIKSTNDIPYNMGGHLIPRMRTPNNSYLEIDEDGYKKLKTIPVFNALVKSGGIVVFTKRPSDIQDPPDVIRQHQRNLEAKNSQLTDEVAELKAYAKEHGIKLGRAYSKEKILAIIKKAEVEALEKKV
jgi:hypothetical protein